MKDYLKISELPNSDFNFFRSRWTPGTCSWIFRNSTFDKWVKDLNCSPRILWIHGKAASGKSTLSSYIIEHLDQLRLSCHYHFIRFFNHESRSASMILRLLACQIAYSMPEYASKIRQFAEANTDFLTADFRNVWHWLYKQALFSLENPNQPLYWIIDGIDEAESPSSIIKLLADLSSSHVPIRVILVSRKTHEISAAIQKVEKSVHIDQISIEGMHDDFRSYIEQEMDLAGADDYREGIIAQLLERSRDNFLWVHLAVQKINTCHTKMAVDYALKDLPPGMEALYDRMATSVEAQSCSDDGKLGKTILSWVICAQRLLSVEELSDALGSIGLLEIQRTISDLCGGFVLIDDDGIVTLIHETALEYLTRIGDRNQPFVIDERVANDILFKSCLYCLMNSKTRLLTNRNQPFALLDYATNAWFTHLSQGSITGPEVMNLVIKFLKGPFVLTWIDIAARKRNLRALTVASRCLNDVALKLRRSQGNLITDPKTIDVIESWATDMVKVVGKFGNSMIKNPEAIHKLIPPFCPLKSTIYQQFGLKESKLLQVSGLTNTTWDDCLAHFSFEQNVMASSVLAAGSLIVILTTLRNSSNVILYSSATFEEQRRVQHPERVSSIQINYLGDLLVSYGYTTTRVWDTVTGDCVKVIQNPPDLPRARTIQFTENDNAILFGDENRCFWRVCLRDNDFEWSLIAEIEEERFEDAMLNFPICSALSPDGKMVAFGYRQHPATVWQLDPPMLLGQCKIALSRSDMTIQEVTWGEVFRLIWHPLSEEVFGLTQVGLLFKWDSFDEETSAKVNTGANYLTISKEGSLIATGDCMGIIKIFTTQELSLSYQLSSQDPVLHLSFSTDSRRIYDIRGTRGSVWEPNILVQLADNSQSHEYNSDNTNDTRSQTKQPSRVEYHSAQIDDIMTIAGQSAGSLYCYGTDNGVSVLCRTGIGAICILTRSASYMSIEQITWSEDGKFVAIADLSGKISIKTIKKTSDEPGGWQVVHILNVSIPLNQGHITGLVFRPNNHNLLVSTLTALFSIVLDSREILERSLPSTVSDKIWACHPMLPDFLLGFGTSTIHVYSWTALEEFAVYFYSPARGTNVETTTNEALHNNGATDRHVESVKNLLFSVDSPYILLSCSQIASSGRSEVYYLLFAVADLHSNNGGPNKIPYVLLPTELTACVREPLALLSEGCLVFLDVDRWICTIYLTSLTTGRLQKIQVSDFRKDAIERYYFLPGDWATADEAQLCTITPDGTLLCPRNGEVGAVQSAKLRKELSYS